MLLKVIRNNSLIRRLLLALTPNFAVGLCVLPTTLIHIVPRQECYPRGCKIFNQTTTWNNLTAEQTDQIKQSDRGKFSRISLPSATYFLSILLCHFLFHTNYSFPLFPYPSPPFIPGIQSPLPIPSSLLPNFTPATCMYRKFSVGTWTYRWRSRCR